MHYHQGGRSDGNGWSEKYRISTQVEGSRPDGVIALGDPTPPPPTSASYPAEIVETKHHEIPRDWTMSTSNKSTSTDELVDNFVFEAVSRLYLLLLIEVWFLF